MPVSSKDARLRALRAAAAERLLDLLYPRLTCPFCGGPAGAGQDAGICPACLAALVSTPVSVLGRVPGATGGFACALHAGPLAAAIRRFKYGPDEALGEPLGRLLAARTAMAVAAGLPVAAVVPVPLHRARLLARGFNQAEVLAEYVARRLGVPLRRAWLRRSRRTATQASLDRTGRLRNMRAAFRADSRVSGADILLIDDVITTGATLVACREALAGAGSVSFATLAAASD
ncbi:MAG: ComF family protein [Chloroflexota bacterium]